MKAFTVAIVIALVATVYIREGSGLTTCATVEGKIGYGILLENFKLQDKLNGLTDVVNVPVQGDKEYHLKADVSIVTDKFLTPPKYKVELSLEVKGVLFYVLPFTKEMSCQDCIQIGVDCEIIKAKLEMPAMNCPLQKIQYPMETDLPKIPDFKADIPGGVSSAKLTFQMKFFNQDTNAEIGCFQKTLVIQL